MSDDLFKAHCKALEEREFAGVFRALRQAFGPKPRLVLAKSLTKAAKPKATKATKPAKPAPLVVVRTKQEPTDRVRLHRNFVPF